MFRGKIIIGSIVLAAFILQACATDAEYDSLQFEKTSWPLDGYETTVDSDWIGLPAGIIQPVKAEVEYKGDRYLIGSFVELESQNDNIFSVFPMSTKNTFLLIGKRSGETCVNVIVNGERKECIDVTVE